MNATQEPASGPALVWFRDDLRLSDQPALLAAVDSGRPVCCVFVLDESSEGIRPLGGASRWWLHQSLRSLADDLERAGSGLVLRRGPAADVIAELVGETGATAIHWNRRYGEAERAVDERIKERCRGEGLEAHSHNASLLFEPWEVSTKSGSPYSVFTPFWRACREQRPPSEPLPAVRRIDGWDQRVPSEDLDSWRLQPTTPDWAGGLRETWEPGERGAARRLRDMVDGLPGYAEGRDRPDQSATSRLSPHLRWGEIGPRQVWHTMMAADDSEAASGFLRELCWREFAYHVLFHHPRLSTENLQRKFDAFPWPPLDEDALRAWQQGRTGYPLVDAGMRELWHSGYMHNRVRMVTASFLTKNLLIDWRIGEAWFWDTLVDADPANNAFNWQWVAGSGADASPYFRVFNPETQRSKFDPDDRYVASWVPDLGTDDYPAPLVDLKESREAALAAYQQVRG
ncbi:deoxyribodipyrimidine photo-lyase [Microlunatus panaciterrae]|uniref:Deoxyribodipyrimidine photo-lyase n=1 Tax=Microlunatus panaciterrae TaxID=400768 RepID=A0ABS2RJN3_9ACTN|nr:deoxyribodipyrimidine photo-lyase [Microlunatus panaciterrae]MBM7798777.1 deoxyribodipyrimidine photo-lyase [Microlunatus panaciterrae]